MNILQILPFVLVAALAMVAVFSKLFDDNFVQRLGLSLLCIGSATAALAVSNGESMCNAGSAMAYGAVLYGLGTVQKVIRFKHENTTIRTRLH